MNINGLTQKEIKILFDFITKTNDIQLNAVTKHINTENLLRESRRGVKQ